MSNCILLAVLFTVLTGVTAGCVQPNNIDNSMQQEGPEASAAPVATPESVSPEEIYNMFLCPCCGGTIDRGCCGISIEMKNYTDELIGAGLSKEEVVIKTVLKYGLNSLINESDKKRMREELIRRLPKNRPQIVIEPEVVDLGNVSVTEGELHTVLYVRNFGMDDLVIKGMDSSCGCVTAALVVDGAEGPRFPTRIRSKNGTGWSQTLTHGQEVQLKVYYNTTFHPDFRGPATRIVTVFSNDLIDSEKKVAIKLNQVD